jgi:hypothetical protein
MLTPADALRRWFGLLFLALASGMVIWGNTILHPHLHGAGFIIFWFLCFLFTLGAILLALLDIRAIRHRSRLEQRELIDRALRETIHTTPDEEEGSRK